MVAEVITESPISISESALVQLQRIHTEQNIPGMQIDWVEGLDNRGFSFVNPNAKDTCGCGQSFSA